MNLEQQFINKIEKIKSSKPQKVDLIKSTIFHEIQQLIYDDISDIDELNRYYDYLFDKLNMVNFEAERQIQEEIKNEYNLYSLKLKQLLIKDGYNELRGEYLRVEMPSELNLGFNQRKSVDKIAQKLNTISKIEIEPLEDVNLSSNHEIILNKIKNLKTK